MFCQGPVCRGCYRVPFAGVGSFEVNRTIVNLLESLPHTDPKPMLKAKCALCKFEDTITVNIFMEDIYINQQAFFRRYVNIVEKLYVENVVDNIMKNFVNILL